MHASDEKREAINLYLTKMRSISLIRFFSEDVAVVVDLRWFTDCHLEVIFNMNTSRVRLWSTTVDGKDVRLITGSARYFSTPSQLSDLAVRLHTTTSLKSISQKRWLYHQMFKWSCDQFNSVDVNHVTSHSSFWLVNRLQLTHTVTTTIST